jgi:hypothetical protein
MKGETLAVLLVPSTRAPGARLTRFSRDLHPLTLARRMLIGKA